MSVSISGGIHVGSDDGAPYYNVHAQIGTLPTVGLVIGPDSSLTISGGLPTELLPPVVTAALGGDLFETVLPPAIAPLVNFQQGAPLLVLGGTEINVPIGIANPLLLS